MLLQKAFESFGVAGAISIDGIRALEVSDEGLYRLTVVVGLYELMPFGDVVVQGLPRGPIHARGPNMGREITLG